MASRLEFEAPIKMLAKQYVWHIKGMEADLPNSIDDFAENSLHLMSGWTPEALPSPPTQEVATELFNVQDGDFGSSTAGRTSRHFSTQRFSKVRRPLRMTWIA